MRRRASRLLQPRRSLRPPPHHRLAAWCWRAAADATPMSCPRTDRCAHSRATTISGSFPPLAVRRNRSSTDGSAAARIRNGVGSYVYLEEFSVSSPVWWSPDGRKLAWMRYDESLVEDYFLQLDQTRTLSDRPHRGLSASRLEQSRRRPDGLRPRHRRNHEDGRARGQAFHQRCRRSLCLGGAVDEGRLRNPGAPR